MKLLIRAEVSAAALRANLARVRDVAPGRRVMAVVKANAYGHGLVPVGRCLAEAGADALAVARLHEAVSLREAGITCPIVLLEGVTDDEELHEALHQQLELVMHSEEQISRLESARAAVPVAWLKIDTGMNRLGVRPERFASALERLLVPRARVGEVRLLTHFASADEPDHAFTHRQIALFETLTRGRALARSLCNSAGVFAHPEAHADWVRPGLALYGASPFPGSDGVQLELVPAMRLVSTVMAVREVRAGESVGYGGMWRAERDARVAILAAGYGDAVPRAMPNGSPVIIAGRRSGIVGRVSMDMTAVDVTSLPDVQVGDEAVLWGGTLPVEEVARHAGTVPYELLCRVSQRVPRLLV